MIILPSFVHMGVVPVCMLKPTFPESQVIWDSPFSNRPQIYTHPTGRISHEANPVSPNQNLHSPGTRNSIRAYRIFGQRQPYNRTGGAGPVSVE